MSIQLDAVDPDALLLAVARAVPGDLLGNITIIGSIASAWAFRGLVANALVATKDVDLLLAPSVSAVGTAIAIGDRLMAAGWSPQYRWEMTAYPADTPADARPALRLRPPGVIEGWFIELLSAPIPRPAVASNGHRLTPRKATSPCPAFAISTWPRMRHRHLPSA